MYARIIEAGPRGRRLFQQWGLIALVVLFLCGAWAFMLMTLDAQKASLLEERQRQLAQLNAAVALQTTGFLRTVETDLRVMDRYLQAHPGIDPLRDAGFAGLVEALRKSSNGVIEFRLVSARGDAYAVPSLDGKPQANVGDRPHFQVQLESGERSFHIGDAIYARAFDKWAIPFSWRLESPVGDVSVLFAGVDLARLSALHEKIRPKPAGSITLVKANGVILVRAPYDQSLIGKDLSPSPNYRNAYGVKPNGTFMTANAITDGVARISSYERLQDYPVIVVVGEGLNEVLEPYMARRDLALALTAVVTLIILTLAGLLQRFLWAMHGAQQNLARRAAIDTLTGTLRRGAFLEIAQREFSRARRYERPAVVAALDLDHFKRVNDTHGHAAGDAVLRECCAAWLTVLREQDFLGRLGGEEFCAILPETDLEGARNVAERLREATSRLSFAGEGAEFSVTVSIGLATVAVADEALVEVLERVDKALYTAKRSGRDRIEVAEPRRLRAAPQAA